MTSRAHRVAVSVVLAVVGVVTLAVGSAGAAASTRVVDDGWWWRLQTGVGPPLARPDVGEDQLVVEATPEGAQAIAAIAAELADGQVNPILTLDVAQDQGGEQATLLACQVGASWTGVHAGAWDAKPLVDCASGSVTGIRSDDESQWTFPLGTLQFNDKFNVVIVPGQSSDGSTPSFSLVFDPPTAASITTVDGTPPPPPTTTTPTTAFTAPPTTSSSSGGGGSFTPPPTSPPATVAPPVSTPAVSPVQPALEPEDLGQSPIAPIIQETTAPAVPVAESVGSRTFARVVGLLILGLAVGLGVMAYRSNELVGVAATAESPVVGGLARFRHARLAEPIDINA